MQTTTQDFAADLRAALRGPARFEIGRAHV